MCFDIWQGQDISVFSQTSRVAPGLTQYPIQSVHGRFSLGQSGRDLKADHSISSSAEVRNERSCASTPPHEDKLLLGLECTTLYSTYISSTQTHRRYILILIRTLQHVISTSEAMWRNVKGRKTGSNWLMSTSRHSLCNFQGILNQGTKELRPLKGRLRCDVKLEEMKNDSAEPDTFIFIL